VLGPLLFALYVNELPSLVSSFLLMFADDQTLPDYSWSRGLFTATTFNVNILHISNNATNCNHQYTLNGVDLELLEYLLPMWLKTLIKYLKNIKHRMVLLVHNYVKRTEKSLTNSLL